MHFASLRGPIACGRPPPAVPSLSHDSTHSYGPDSPAKRALCTTIRMATAAPELSRIQVSREDLKRFMVHSALLALIDPVRAEPTRASLDDNPDSDTSGGQKLKEKFLDAFALICSTSKMGAETASAVCLEQHVASASILRVARNRGLAPEPERDPQA